MKYLLVLVLAGCTTLPKVPEKVLVPIAVSCIKDAPIKPDFITRNSLKQLSASDYVISITSEYLKQSSYIGELEATIQGCK